MLLTLTSDEDSNYDYTTNFSPPLELSPDLEWTVLLQSGFIFNAPRNLDAALSPAIQWTNNSGVGWLDVNLAPGLYTFESLNTELATRMEEEGDVDAEGAPFIEITANSATGYVRIVISSATYQIKFFGDIATICGAVADTAYTSTQDLDNPPLFDENINSVLVHSDIVAPGSSFINGVPRQTLLSKSIDSFPFSKLDLSAVSGAGTMRLPANSGRISSIRVWITAEDGYTPFITPGYKTSITLYLTGRRP